MGRQSSTTKRTTILSMRILERPDQASSEILIWTTRAKKKTMTMRRQLEQYVAIARVAFRTVFSSAHTDEP
tara:strand:+ start:247 stop:459 length:213 start_codon:yes stop_codon:yes gene_type:complete